VPSTRRGDSPTSTVFVEPGTSFVLYDAPLLSAVTGLEWACAVASIDSETYAEFARDPGLTPLETYVREKIRHQFGFPSYDTKCMLRLLVEAFPAEEAVTYDLTDLVLDGEFESTSDAAGYADHLASQDYDRSRFAITLTEGSSDRWIIERSFKVLSPHLSDFFSFMDFGGANMPGGAGQLANIVKSFAGAKIAN